MDKKKTLYKLAKSNKYTLEDLAAIVDLPQDEVVKIYKTFGGDIPPTQLIVGQDDLLESLCDAIRGNKHVILHGEPGIGKTICAKESVRRAGRVLKIVNISDLRTGQLLAEWLYGSHQTPSDIAFVFDEIDNFHWQSHAYFKKVLEESKVSIIMTCNNISKVSKTVVDAVKKNGSVIKVSPPDIDDLRKFLKQRFPSKVEQAAKIYDKDFRVVMRRILFNIWDTRVIQPDVKTTHVVGAIFGEPNAARRLSKVKANEDPVLWLTTWLDYNAARFIPQPDKLFDFLDKLSRTESRMFKTKQGYLNRMFASLPCPGRKGTADFPAALFNAEREPKKEEVVEEEVKKVEATKVVVSNVNTFDPFSF